MRNAVRVAATIAVAGSLAGSLDAASAPTTAAGAYTASQATEGAALYAANCAMCHGETLEGTLEIPALKGKFIANWSGSPLGELVGYVHEAMPQFAPGSLAPEDSARIVAYLLRENGMPAGARPLEADEVRRRTVLFAPPPAPPR